MTTVLPFSNNTIQVFAYEGFSYTISNPNPSLFTLQNVSNTTGLNTGLFTKNGNTSYTFAATDTTNNLTAGTSEAFQLTVTDVSGGIQASSNTVVINPGRFLDGSGNTLSNNIYTFFKNEPITPIRLVAPSFELLTPTSVPTLPPGLTYSNVASNIFDIVGTPFTTVPTSNYLIIGRQNGGSKIVTTRFNISVSNERVRVDLSGSPIISNMEVGTPIATRVFTTVPPVGSTTVRYTYPQFPDGIVVSDISGNVQSSLTFTPTDPSYTMVISGTPTITAANAFRDAGATSNGIVFPIQVSRVSPLPLVQSSQALTFAFGETVLFDTPVLSPLYAGIPVDGSSNFFRAQTYFTSNVPITNILSSDIGLSLELVYIPSLSRANLSGTPTAGTTSFTVGAINSNGTTRDIQQTITVLNDAVSFTTPPTPAVDVCYSFILSRPLTQDLSGYYPTPIRFQASAASGLPLTFSAPVLAGTGLSLSNVTSNTVQLVGVPSSITPLTTLTVTASAVGSPATADTSLAFSIINDVFTFADISASKLNFTQNVSITPFQFPVSTLSGRNIINYSQVGFPAGVNIDPVGFVSGIPSSSSPTAGNVTITATTGFASGSRDFSYNLTPDSMIFFLPGNINTYSYQAGDPVGSIDVNAVAFSGRSVSNYDLSISPTYGLTVNTSNGIISGTWTDSLPPNEILPSSCNFTMTAQAGSLTGSLPMSFTADPVLKNAMLFVARGNPTGEPDSLDSYMYYTTPSDVSSFTRVSNGFIPSDAISDIQIKTNDPTNNVILAVTNDGTVFRGTTFENISNIQLNAIDETLYPGFSSIAHKPGTSTWWLGGSRLFDPNGYKACIVKSIDDGVTWDLSGALILSSDDGGEVYTRDSNRLTAVSTTSVETPYLSNGIALKYKDGILMAGGLYDGADGPVMIRSSNEGVSWNDINGDFDTGECAAFSLDASSIWIATGSSKYQSRNINDSSYEDPPADTIKYSTDQGSNWSNASGSFNMFGYEVVYGNNTWLATGVTKIGTSNPQQELRFSTNGSNWTKIDLSTGYLFDECNTTVPTAPLRIGSLNFDGNFWNVFANVYVDEVDPAVLRLYRHDASTSLASGWFAVDVNSSLESGEPDVNSNLRMLALTPPRYLYTDDPPINITLGFNQATTGGPTFTSPTTTSYLLYQYIPITPIQLSATGVGQVYFFLETEDIPAGLSYDRTTNQITGAPVQIGNDTLTIYAKDDVAITQLVIKFTTVLPRVIRKQDGAGAYTSLVRQYTVVNAAQNSVNGKTLPATYPPLGEFTRPYPPDVVTQRIDPKCYSTSNCP